MPSDCRKSRSTASKTEKESKMIIDFMSFEHQKTARETSSFPCGCLLSAKLNSNVPAYADEFNLAKYNFLFRTLPVCRQFVDTLSQGKVPWLLFRISEFINITHIIESQKFFMYLPVNGKPHKPNTFN